jgi:ABC-type transporter Mla MlaB component
VSLRQPPDPDDRVLVIGGPIAAGDLASICERLRVLATAGVEVVCDVRAVVPDAASVDALARLQLTARRLGCRIRLEHVSRELGQLLGFCGLSDVLARAAGSAVQAQRQPEEREHPGRVEEGVDRHDPAA